MKKYFLFIIIIVLSIILTSGCTSSGNQTANNTSNIQTYSGDQFTFNYPPGWQQIASQAQNSTVAVGDPSTADSNGNVQVNVEIQKSVKPSNVTFGQYYNDTYTQFAAQNLGYKQLSDGTIVVNGKTALENVYRINMGTLEQKRAVWIQNGKIVYIILCTAPVSQYNNQQANFNIIVNSFKLI